MTGRSPSLKHQRRDLISRQTTEGLQSESMTLDSPHREYRSPGAYQESGATPMSDARLPSLTTPDGVMLSRRLPM